MANQRGMTGSQATKALASLAKMKGAVFTLTGDKRLIKNLTKVRDSVARKAMRKALGKAVRLIVKGMKAAVPADLKGMKTAIGGSVGKAKSGDAKGQFTAKAGAAVGKAAKKVGKRSGSGKGVGISGRNIHWWILGTAQRTVRNTGKNVGAMPPQAPEVVKQGFASASGPAAAVIKSTIAAELAKVK